MLVPVPRGPLSGWLAARLLVHDDVATAPPSPAVTAHHVDALHGDDLQLALWMCYELHYQGFDDAAADLEWVTDVLTFRAELERVFVDALRAEVGPIDVRPREIPTRLFEVTSDDSGRSLSNHLQRRADRAAFAEFVMHRSVYHLKEADPHTFAIPRLRGAAKAAMIEIQADEYGGGRVERMHSTLFARLMDSLRLSTAYGEYVDCAPGITLATSNLMSMFGLHRRWRGAAAGHLAAIEMTSSLPNRRYGQGLRRLGGDDLACAFYDEHVEADAVHEQIAAHDLCGTLALDQPEVAEDIVFGAAACMRLEQLFADHLLDAWSAQRSSLLPAARRAA
ncbi:iron-containing redox enzyme family protein [uncultured Jatrophihabitans sp.]|uniref:iron-containing redox enzyme family protein n=1 Tax=uncultured Jatrophihabitans sp. TaxID=1610747 RepID=UPI0035CCA82C